MMRADNRVVIEGIHRVMPGPFTLHTNGLKLRDAMRQYWPYMIFPKSLIHREVIKINGRVVRCLPPTLISAATILAHMNTGRVDRQRQIAVKRPFCPEQPSEPLARFDRHINAGHRGSACCAWPRSIDQLAAGNHLAAGQRHTFDASACAVTVYGNNIIGNIFNTAFTRLPAPPVKDRAAFPIPFINKVD